MIRSLCLVLLASAIATVHAVGVDRPWTHYREMMEMTKFDRFYAAPAAQRDKVVMQGMIKPNDASIPPGDVVFTVINGAERSRIPVNTDGSFVLPWNAEWNKSNPGVYTNVPAGQKARFSIRVLPVVPQKRQLDYTTLMGGVPQLTALMKAQAGMLSFMVPKFVGVELRFPKESRATVSVQAPDGVRKIQADASGIVKVAFDKALLAANVPVQLSELPIAADFMEE